MLNKSVSWIGLVVFLIASVALGAQGTIEADGEAMIKRGDKVKAKKSAIADAMKNAVEKVVGVAIESDFSSELKETVKNNQSNFSAKVRDTVLKKSEGFIKTWDLVSERADGDVFKVRIKATVFESKLKAEVVELAKLLKDAGNPKVMIVIQDVYISPDGFEQVRPESIFGMHVERELMQKGIEVRGKSAAAEVTGGSTRAYDRWSRETDNIATMARKQSADILIFGRIEIRDKGKIENASFAALNGQTRVEITATVRGVNAATGQPFSVNPVQMSEMGLNVEKAMYRALKGRGKNLVTRTFNPLFEDLKDSFRKTASSGSSFVVQLKGVKNFRKQGRKFVKILEDLSGVSNVSHSFNSGKLTVELSCKCDSQGLQNSIFDAIEDNTTFEDVDIDGISGKKLTFKM